MNNYYNFTGGPFIPGTKARSDQVNTEYQAIVSAFDKLPISDTALVTGKATFAGTTGGTGNAYTVTMPNTRTANVNGDEVVFLADRANTGAATLNVDGIGAISLVRNDGVALAADDIGLGLIYIARYDSANTRFLLVTPTKNAATAAAAAAASAAAASASASYAAEWANKAEDSLISAAAGGDLIDDYSALHWANKAAGWAASVNLPSITGNALKFLRANAGETGLEYFDLLNSFNSWVAQRFYGSADTTQGILVGRNAIDEYMVSFNDNGSGGQVDATKRSARVSLSAATGLSFWVRAAGGAWTSKLSIGESSIESTSLLRTNGTGTGVGAGVGLQYITGTGYLDNYDYTGAAWGPLSIRGSTTTIQSGASPTTALTVTSSQDLQDAAGVSLRQGKLIDVQVYSSGSGTWTKPTGANKVEIILVGAGGGGAGAGSGSTPATGCDVGGSGAGAGGIWGMWNASELDASCSYSVGVGGAGGIGVGAAGSNGGNSTFSFGSGSLTGNGGGGGSGALTTNQPGNSGNAGGASDTTGATPDFLFTMSGQNGLEGSVVGNFGVNGAGGGASVMFLAGPGGGTDFVGTNGFNGETGPSKGGGGSGAIQSSNGTTATRTGGAGSAGLIIVKTYA